MSRPLIEIKNLNKSFEDARETRRPIRDLSLTIQAGEWITFLGPNGCGKSTMMNLLASLLSPDSGEIIFQGESPPRPGMMFQNPALLPWLDVLGNVQLPRLGNPELGGQPRAMECLARTGLEGCGHLLPHQLSGGMKSRAALAQMLFSGADLYLLDEPFASLDDFHRDKLIHEFMDLKEKSGTTTVLVTHDIADAVYVSDRIVLLNNVESKSSIQSVLEVPLQRPRIRALRRTETFARMVHDIQDAASAYLSLT